MTDIIHARHTSKTLMLRAWDDYAALIFDDQGMGAPLAEVSRGKLVRYIDPSVQVAFDAFVAALKGTADDM